MTAPYTHADHAKQVVIAYYKGDALGIKRKHVQARVGKTICCATIVDAWDTPDGLEMWKLDLNGPIYGRMSTPTRNVRACQAVDGLCTCVAFDLVPDSTGDNATQAPSGAPVRSVALVACSLPDGNHGEYFPECRHSEQKGSSV